MTERWNSVDVLRSQSLRANACVFNAFIRMCNFVCPVSGAPMRAFVRHVQQQKLIWRKPLNVLMKAGSAYATVKLNKHIKRHFSWVSLGQGIKTNTDIKGMPLSRCLHTLLHHLNVGLSLCYREEMEELCKKRWIWIALCLFSNFLI